MTEDDLQTPINAAKIVCILAIPGVVARGLLGGPPSMLCTENSDCPEFHVANGAKVWIAPLPFMVILFLQRVREARERRNDD